MSWLAKAGLLQDGFFELGISDLAFRQLSLR
jgi:hypothetical protein